MSHDRIERETTIAAPVDRVWALLTEPEHVGTWFGDAGAEIDLRPGGALVLRWAEHGTVHGRVERVEPGRLFAYRWAAAPADAHAAGDALDDGNSTLVEFSLTEEDDGTRLRVVESGFAALRIPEAEQVRKAEGNTEGWKHELGDLVEYADADRTAGAPAP
jgi:uncharacterized protein YndB with AHSA1/START domain